MASQNATTVVRNCLCDKVVVNQILGPSVVPRDPYLRPLGTSIGPSGQIRPLGTTPAIESGEQPILEQK